MAIIPPLQVELIDKWFDETDQPPCSKDDPRISITVLIYDSEFDDHGLGWYDFDGEMWHWHNDYELPENFKWTILPKPL